MADAAGEQFLLLFELQYRHDPTMPRRMNAYASLAEQTYDLPVCPVLVNFQPPPAGTVVVPTYESSCFGMSVRREFRTINLWEVPAAEAIQSSSPALLALLPFLQGGDDLRLVEQALTVLRAHERGRDLETLLLYLIRQVGGDAALQRLGARLDRTMLQDTRWFDDIFDEGQDAGMRRVLQHQLRRRFGRMPADIELALGRLGGDDLDALGTAVLEAASLDDFRARLPGSYSLPDKESD